VKRFYRTAAAPLALSPGVRSRLPGDAPAPTLGSFGRAYALVSSRAFVVDQYHGLAMVPIADACVRTHSHPRGASQADVRPSRFCPHPQPPPLRRPPLPFST
jgi:hypothetical protein